MKKIFRQTPNILSTLRIVGAITILFLEPLSAPFFIVYGIAMITDPIDGFIARRFHLESRLGSIIDSVADWCLELFMAIRVLPYLLTILEWWNWVIIIVPFVLHILAYIICFAKFHCFSSLHTYVNKLMSAAICVYPFTFIGEIYWLYNSYEIFFGLFALYGSIEMNLIHILSDVYDESNKSLLIVLHKRKEKNPNKGYRHRTYLTIFCLVGFSLVISALPLTVLNLWKIALPLAIAGGLCLLGSVIYCLIFNNKINDSLKKVESNENH